MTTIAVIAMGDMGAGIGARLVRGGARVITSLQGRSEASVKRAREAGVEAATEAEIGQADYLLSIVPPATACAVAQKWADAVARTPRKPVFLDCNAVSVETSAEIGAIVAAAGMRYIDASIIGAPGGPDAPGPALYLSGEQPQDVARLRGHGLRARSTGGPAGAASALKMAYAGINKGLTGLAAAMVLAASRAGAADALRTELGESVPRVLEQIRHTLPDMYSKAWRWDFEMQQVAGFAGADPHLAQLYQGLAGFYATFGRDWAGERESAAAIDAFLGRGKGAA
jgi:3-hydroxyisobutyrate dehydrogenase-like beta-hydroxyacid dehydrogenase